jgi:hypothetical protein
MDARSIIAGWKRRLTTLADNPPYVFRDTPHYLIEKHYQRLTIFVGYTEDEVVKAEARLRVRFPSVFREYLRTMAKSPGDLFRGSDLAGLSEFEQFRSHALKVLAPEFSLPPEAVVFLSHQGYIYLWLLAIGGFDGPVLQVKREPQQVAATFAEMVDAELQLMQSNNRRFREHGGYYLTLHPEGGTTESFPALASGERPLDQIAPTERRW